MDEKSMELLVQLLTSFGGGGVLVWYLWHTTTKTIPEINENHAQTIKAVTDRFDLILKDEREARKQELESFKHWATHEACRYTGQCGFNKDRA